MWTTEPTYDEEGEVETEGVADMYSVDVLWNETGIAEVDESNKSISYPYGWVSKEITVKETIHTLQVGTLTNKRV